MSEFCDVAQLILILAGLVAVIPWLIWAILAAVKKRWRRLAWLGSVPLAWLALTWSLRELGWWINIGNLYSVHASLGASLFHFETPPDHFHGDGYSIVIYRLPPAIRERFLHADASLLDEYPKPPAIREKWLASRWHATPSEVQHAPYLDFTTYLPAYLRQLPAAEEKLENLRQTLQRPGSYYACFYKGTPDELTNVDLFVIDLPGGLLYQINQNT